MQYSVLAKELDLANANTTTNLSGDHRFDQRGAVSAGPPGPGADLTNYFHFHATNSVVNGTNINLQGLRFELYNLTGNGDMTLQTNALPLAPPFFQTSQNSGNNPELIRLHQQRADQSGGGLVSWACPTAKPTTSVTPSWWASRRTCISRRFPARKARAAAAVGAGHAGAISSVYHVTTKADSGPGSLRATRWARPTARWSLTLRGTINLASPLCDHEFQSDHRRADLAGRHHRGRANDGYVAAEAGMYRSYKFLSVDKKRNWFAGARRRHALVAVTCKTFRPGRVGGADWAFGEPENKNYAQQHSGDHA